jgi:hypothetical protein
MEDPVHELYVKKLQGIINANQVQFKEESSRCIEPEAKDIKLEEVFKISEDSDY